MNPIQPQHDQDPLKAFVDANRDAFDSEEPRPLVWEALERSMPGIEVKSHEDRAVQPRSDEGLRLTPPKQDRDYSLRSRTKPQEETSRKEGGIIRQLYPFWRKAAVACMLLTIGVLGGLLLAGDGAQEVAEQPSTETRALELEQYYKREIDRRLAMVASYKPEPELRRELSDMAQSDYRMMQPFDEIPPGNERVVLETIAQEYQAKLHALERVIDRLREAERDQPKLNQPGPRGREEL